MGHLLWPIPGKLLIPVAAFFSLFNRQAVLASQNFAVVFFCLSTRKLFSKLDLKELPFIFPESTAVFSHYSWSMIVFGFVSTGVPGNVNFSSEFTAKN